MRRLGSLLALACSLIVPAAASAQIVDVQSRFGGTPKEGLHGRLAGSVDWRTGNTEYLELRGAFTGQYSKGRHLVLLLAQAERGTSGTKIILDHTLEHLRYRFRWTGLLQPEAFVQHELDRFRRLELRLLAGAGMRFTLLDRKTAGVAAGLAVMGEHELLASDGQPDAGQVTSDVRLSSYLLGRVQVMKRVDLVETVYAQPRIDDLADLRILEETSLVVKANSVLSVTVAFVLGYDSRPPDAVKALDTQLTTTISLAF